MSAGATPPGPAAAERRAEIDAAELRRLSDIQRRAEKVKLSDPGRLRAALHVRLMADRAKAAGIAMAEIREAVQLRCQGHVPRLERYMLRQGIDAIDRHIEAEFKDRPEPLKALHIYLDIVAALAGLIGDAPEQHQIDMLRQTREWERRPAGVTPDLETDKRLADLLHACARSLAARHDLPALLRRAQVLNAGWCIDTGPWPFHRGGALHADFDPARPPAEGREAPDALPPWPAAALGRIGVGTGEVRVRIEDPADQDGEGRLWDAPFDRQPGAVAVRDRGWRERETGALDPETGKPWFAHVEATATVTVWRDLCLCIASINRLGGYGAVLLDVPAMTLRVEAPAEVAGTYAIAASTVGMWAAPASDQPLRTACGRRILPPEGQTGIGPIAWRKAALDDVRFPPDPADLGWPDTARFLPLDPKRVRAWLSDAGETPQGWTSQTKRLDIRLRERFDFKLDDTAETPPPAWWDDPEPAQVLSVRSPIWHAHHQSASLGAHVEAALVSGLLERRLSRWIATFAANLAALEAAWIAEGEEAEATLRDRWRLAEIAAQSR